MLPKSKRLNLKKDFKWVASGKHRESLSFKVLIKEGQNTYPKVGIAVSSKNFKLAVLRNKARRLSFKALSPLYPTLKSNLNLVIMPRAQVLEKDLKSLSQELTDLLK